MKQGRSIQTAHGIKRDCKYFTMIHLAPPEYGARCRYFDKFIELCNCQECDKYANKHEIRDAGRQG